MGDEPLPAVVPRNLLRACVLLLLREQPGHGYDLLQRLAPFGCGDDPGRLYRALRALEREGLVHSTWEASPTGPDRRIYEPTRPGMEHLHRSATAIATARETLGTFLSRYGEFVALRPEARWHTDSSAEQRL